MKTAIYTVLLGKYDWLNDISRISKSIDSICYSDEIKLCNKEYYKGWKIINYTNALKNIDIEYTSNKRKRLIESRLLKFYPHKHLSQYDRSLYIDAKVLPRKDILELIDKLNNCSADLGLFRHPYRDSIKKEICHCYWNNKISSLEFRKIKKWYFKLKKDIEYIDDILFENAVRFTNHKSNIAKRMLDETYKIFYTLPYRDQLILPIVYNKYLKSKNKIITLDYSNRYFIINPHKVNSFKNIRRYILSRNNNIILRIISFPINVLLKVVELIYEIAKKGK